MLRTAIADRYTARGLPTSPDQILVTNGAQGALSLIVTALTSPGDRVLVEHPSYPNALGAIARQGARPVPLPMVPGPNGTAGWDLELATAAVRDAAPKLTYLIPDFQNPTAAVLDASGREQVVDLARRTGTPVIADETLAELWFEEPPPAPLAAHGAADSPLVLTVGSASKVFWGGLRIGWIRTSAPLVRRLAAFRSTIDLGSPLFEQVLVAKLLDGIEVTAPRRRAELRAGRTASPSGSRRCSRRGRSGAAWRHEPLGRPRLTGFEPARDGRPPARRGARGRATVRVGRRVRAVPEGAVHAAPRPHGRGADADRGGLVGDRPVRARDGSCRVLCRVTAENGQY